MIACVGLESLRKNGVRREREEDSPKTPGEEKRKCKVRKRLESPLRYI